MNFKLVTSIRPLLAFVPPVNVYSFDEAVQEAPGQVLK
jgi:hypothetical protein